MRIGVLASMVLIVSSGLVGCEPADPGGDDGGATTSPLELEITSPTATVHTNGRITVQVVVVRGQPENVLLEKDGVPFVNLVPPYQYEWDTTSEAEGAHQLRARATAGDVSAVSSTRTIMVDRTAPTVVARFPLPGSRYACREGLVRVEFSEPVRTGTTQDAPFTLTGPAGALTKTLAWSQENTIVTLSPEAPPSWGTTVSVTIGSSVTDLAGNTLLLPADAWSWEYPEYCSMTGVEPINAFGDTHPGSMPSSLNTAITVDPSHHPAVIWTQTNSCRTYTRRWQDGAWGTQELVSNGCTPPQLRFNREVAFIALQSDSDVFLLRQLNGLWQPLGGALNVDTAVHGHGPSVVFDAAGNPIVSWWERSAGNPIHVKRWAGEGWEPLGGVVDRNDVGSPSIALAADGNPMVAFAKVIDKHSTIFVKRWDGSEWVAVGGAIGRGDAPQLRVSARGVPYVSYLDRIDRDDVMVAEWTGSEWVHRGGGLNLGEGDASQPTMVLDALGLPVVAFTQVADASRTVVHVRRWTDRAWVTVGGPFALNPAAAVGSPGLTLDANDRPILSLTEETAPGSRSVFVWRFNE